MTTHDLHDERSLVRGCSRDDTINGLNNTMKSRVRADGHISSTKVWNFNSISWLFLLLVAPQSILIPYHCQWIPPFRQYWGGYYSETVPRWFSQNPIALEVDQAIPVKTNVKMWFSEYQWCLVVRYTTCRKQFAPVRDPSPPMTTKLVMFRSTRFLAAVSRPALSLNDMQRAEPMIVPPRWMMPDTDDQWASTILSPPWTIPWSKSSITI